MVVAFYFRLHLAYFPRPVVAIFARPEQFVIETAEIGSIASQFAVAYCIRFRFMLPC